jgi:hypothetical protein
MRSIWWQIALIVAFAVVVALAGCGSRQGPRSPVARSRHTSQAAASRPATVSVTPASPSVRTPSGDDDDESYAATSQVVAARPAAKAFFSSYVSYLYGRLAASRVAGADRSLRWQLEHGRARITPAERASRPRIACLSLASAGPPVSVVATAVVAVDNGRRLRLSATLEPYRHAWLVVAVGG